MQNSRDKHKLLDKARQQPKYLKSALQKIHRARIRMIVCMLTLPVYGVAVWILISNNRNIDALLWIYMGCWAVFAIDMAIRKCPRCGEQFYVRTLILNLITKRCVHCGLSEESIKEDAEAEAQDDS
ncbi:MAG: hypothetical protein ACR2PR_06680 [Pseudohongiellaceae bacterium]